MNVIKAFTGVLFCLIVSVSHADDWPRFRGPNGSGTSDSSVPLSWTPDANIAWKAALPGGGVSSPIVVGDRVFVTCYSGYGLDRNSPGEIANLKRHLVCFDAKSGEKKWQRDIDAVLPEDPYSGIGVTAHGYASHTPVSDGERVFAYFGKTGAFAFDLDGNQLWQASLGEESDPWAWGSSSSPIVHDDLLIVTASAESQAIVGLDKATGNEVWRQEAAGLDGMWGTPLIVNTGDRTDLVMSVAREIWGLDPKTGKLRWFCDATGAEQAHSSAVAVDGLVFAFTGRGGGSIAVRAGGKGDVTDSNIEWTGRESARFGSPVGDDSYVYLVANGVINLIDRQTGKRLKQTRLKGASRGGGRFGGSDYASPVIADGKLFYLNGSGQTFVFSLGEDLTQLSVNLVTTDKESFGGTPAISEDRMFLRSNKNLYCVADSGETVKANASLALMDKADPDADDGERAAGGRGGRGGRGGFNPASMFNDRDTNKDGKLTADELEGSPLANRINELDKDGDEAVTLEEFQTGLRAMFGGGRGGRGGGRGGRGGGRGGRGGGRGGGEDDKRPQRPQRPEVDERVAG